MVTQRPDSTPEPTLVHDVAGGSLEAYGRLYDRTCERVYGLALRICRDPDRATAVVEQVFVELWKGRQALRSTETLPEMWLLDRCRQIALSRSGAASGTAANAPRTYPAVSPAAAVHDSVEDTLSHMPAAERTALELAYFEGLSTRRIAERMGTSADFVMTQLRLALDRLRPILRHSNPVTP